MFGLAVLQYRGQSAAPIDHRFGARPEGTYGTLDACFDAPDLVKHVLCDHAGINVTYLADGDAAAARAICNATGARLVFVPGERHAMTVSSCALRPLPMPDSALCSGSSMHWSAKLRSRYWQCVTSDSAEASSA